MRKTRIIAFVVASIVSTAAVSGAQSPAQAPQRAARAEGRAAGQRGTDRRPARALFRGITLSEAEKSKLKEIRANHQKDHQALRESLRPVMTEMRAARQKHDTAAVRAAFSKAQAGRERMRAQMEREQAEMRNALSSENQQKFDANVKQLKDRLATAQERGAAGDRDGRDARGAGRAGRAGRAGGMQRPGRGFGGGARGGMRGGRRNG